MSTLIGLTGSFGSGCTYIANNYLVPLGYKYISLSDELKRLKREATRHELQALGNQIRKEKGADYLAKLVLEQIRAQPEQEKWVIDSIRNPAEVELIQRSKPGFFLFAVYADVEVRWARVSEQYGESREMFNEDDRRDSGDQEEDYGQRIADCYIKADVIIANNEHITNKGLPPETTLRVKVEQYVSYAEGRTPFLPDEDEAMMAMAYANGFRSKCLKRKVGAIIVDPMSNVISSGYNEVPPTEKSCSVIHHTCYRDKIKKSYAKQLQKLLQATDKYDEVMAVMAQFKNLDHCRSLHAEEMAILNAPSHIRSFVQGSNDPNRVVTLYVTTYPCNLCANKIASSSIRRVVYLEPYPMKEAKDILTNAGVKQLPFEGVTFNGYFRFQRNPGY